MTSVGVVSLGRATSPDMASLLLRGRKSQIAITARDLAGLGQPQDPSVEAAGACSAAQVQGLVPGVCYPANFPATTPQLVDGAVAALPQPARGKVGQLRQKRIDGPSALAYHTAWGNAAWASIVEGDGIYSKLADQRMPSGAWLGMAPKVSEWSTTPPFGFVPGLKEFFEPWRGQLDDIRRAWDRMHEPKLALRAALGTLPPGQPIDDATNLEVLRQVAYFAGIVGTVQASVQQQSDQMRAFIVRREYEGSFAQLLDDLKDAPAALGRAMREVLRIALEDIVAPLVGALVPWWLWAGLLGVGGLVVYGVVAGHPAVGATRAAYGRLRGR